MSAQPLLSELSRLSQLSAQMEKPKQERKARADTKKNRLALFDACETRNLHELTRLIEIGAPLDILNERDRTSSKRTLLAVCAGNDWADGIGALLDAGASEKNIPGYFDPPPKAAPGRAQNQSAMSCLEVAASLGKTDAFMALFEAHDEPTQVKAIGLIREPELFLACQAIGKEALFDPARLDQMLMASVESLDPTHAGNTKNSPKCAAFDAISALRGTRAKPKACAELWIRALGFSRPGIIQGLASRGIPLPEEGLPIVPKRQISQAKALSSWINSKKSPTSWDANRITHEYNAESEKTVMLGLATASLALTSHYQNSHDNAYALCAIEPIRRDLLASSLGLHLLARSLDLRLYKRLSSLGADLSCFVDDLGNCPLHRAIKSESKTTVEALARLHPAWISHRNTEGKTPIEMMPENQRSSMSALLDQIGMRDGLRGRLGSRHVPAKTKRL